MRYRLLIQNREEQDKHIACISFETNHINKIIPKIKKLLKKEISKRKLLFSKYLMNKKKGFIKQLINEIPEDLIDWKSKGKDISKEEFLENELNFELMEQIEERINAR